MNEVLLRGLYADAATGICLTGDRQGIATVAPWPAVCLLCPVADNRELAARSYWGSEWRYAVQTRQRIRGILLYGQDDVLLMTRAHSGEGEFDAARASAQPAAALLRESGDAGRPFSPDKLRSTLSSGTHRNR